MSCQAITRNTEQAGRRRSGRASCWLTGSSRSWPKNVLEVGQPVGAAGRALLADQQDRERRGQRLGEDREVRAPDPAPEDQQSRAATRPPSAARRSPRPARTTGLRNGSHHAGQLVPSPSSTMKSGSSPGRRPRASGAWPWRSRRARRTRPGRGRACRRGPRPGRCRARRWRSTGTWPAGSSRKSARADRRCAERANSSRPRREAERRPARTASARRHARRPRPRSSEQALRPDTAGRRRSRRTRSPWRRWRRPVLDARIEQAEREGGDHRAAAAGRGRRRRRPGTRRRCSWCRGRADRADQGQRHPGDAGQARSRGRT